MLGCEALLKKLVFAIIIILFCGVSIVNGGDWHQPEQLICSDCHTMHYSEGGMMPIKAKAGGPFSQLLLASTANILCLTCHDGTDTDAPDVVSPVTYTFDSAGGYFANSGGIASDYAHNLGMSSGETPPGSSDSLILSCTSCHNPHGNSNYRNLLLNPAGSGNSTDSNVSVSQTNPADGPVPEGNSPADVYVPSNVLYRSGMSEWCNDCHTDFHGATESETGSSEPWFRHPQDLTINGTSHADYNYWSGDISNRVEVESPSETIPGLDNEVFCLSCHKAHGSAYKSSLIYADENRMLSTCQQCHNQSYESTKHGDEATGVNRVSNEPKGDCVHCHDEHASRDGLPTPGGPYDYLLFKENDKNLCYTSDGSESCHASSGANVIYQGSTVYDNSSHATSADMYWPGPTPPSRPSSDYGECLNCHTPHGYEDASGLIPSQTFSREENLCQTCHDGFPASDIKSEMAMTQISRHPTVDSDYSNRHNPSENNANDFGSSNRHAECSDCHNAHYAKSDAITLLAPDVSERNKRVSGVDVINGTAGSQPSYNYISPDVGIDDEYQLCFKCHSSWTTQPGGKPDMAVLFNLNNPSYHPVEAQGTNTYIEDGAFVNGWRDNSTVYCTDCHTSDNISIRGPHGSRHRHILKNYYVASSNSRTMSSDELCFDCHNYDTYADKNASETVKQYSRFAGELKDGIILEEGHGYHVDEKQYPCYICHDSHASTTKPHLIVTGRNPGINSFTPAGPNAGDKGSCTPTCHGQKDYEIVYDRW